MSVLDIDAKWLPNRKALEVAYKKYLPTMTDVLYGMERKLKEILVLPSVPTLKTRVKSFSSYYRKLLRILTESAETTDLPVISDLIGIRVICPFLEDLSMVEKILKDSFKIIEIEKKGADRTFREFGYESTHVLLEIPEDVRKNCILPPNIICEIQIRTILQDAWAEVEHELVYKSEFSPFDLPLKRKLASMNASLSLADIIFQEIRDYQNKLNKEMAKRRDSFYDQVSLSGVTVPMPDMVPDEGSLIGAKIGSDEALEPASFYVQGTIDDLLLDAIHAHNSGDFKRAIDIYTKIIDTKPNDKVLTVIYKHRGMAYFSQSNYEKAKEDFLLSAKAEPENYRAFYYMGIVLSVEESYKEAIKYFSKSLEINQFRPYAYFRRAQCWYHLGDNSSSMADLDKAVSLGLSKKDEESLRMLLIKDFDKDL